MSTDDAFFCPACNDRFAAEGSCPQCGGDLGDLATLPTLQERDARAREVVGREACDDELVGEIVGNCRIEALLGPGGMARVYRAFHLSLERTSAVKILSDERYVALFFEEARA